VQSEASQPDASVGPRPRPGSPNCWIAVCESGGKGGRFECAWGRPFLGNSFERFSRSTTLPHDAELNRVSMSTSMPGMSARHLLAPVVAFKCVLHPFWTVLPLPVSHKKRFLFSSSPIWSKWLNILWYHLNHFIIYLLWYDFKNHNINYYHLNEN